MKRILVVEDDNTIRQLIVASVHKVARSHEIEVEINEAKDAQEAKTHIDTHGQYDLVCLDWNFPGGGGKTVLPFLRQVHPTTRVIVVSGQDIDEARSIANKEGIKDENILRKPFMWEQFRKVLSELLI